MKQGFLEKSLRFFTGSLAGLGLSLGSCGSMPQVGLDSGVYSGGDVCAYSITATIDGSSVQDTFSRSYGLQVGNNGVPLNNDGREIISGTSDTDTLPGVSVTKFYNNVSTSGNGVSISYTSNLNINLQGSSVVMQGNGVYNMNHPGGETNSIRTVDNLTATGFALGVGNFIYFLNCEGEFIK